MDDLDQDKLFGVGRDPTRTVGGSIHAPKPGR